MNTINEKISAWFEPKPDKPQPAHLSHSRSPNGCWHWDREHKAWINRLDYFTDEAANARLLEAMPEPTLKVDRYSGNWLCYASPAFTMLDHKDRKTAVVMAFCKWAGIEP